MGNSSSKPGPRQTSTSSTTPLSDGLTSPTTPTPLLTGFTKSAGSPDAHRLPTSPFAPETPATPVFALPHRPDSGVNEVTVARFAGDSPPDSRPSSGQDACALEPISDISHPKPARPHIRHLSELIDPVLMAEDDEKAIRSPSGNLLCRRSFEEREDRPLSMRERQERVRQQVLLQRTKMGLQSGPDLEKTEKNRKTARGCCACFGS